MRVMVASALAVAGLFVWSPMLVAAQAVQPTGQAAPVTQNPQHQPQQQLGAPTSDLHGAFGSRSSGASLNQSAGQSQKISIPRSAVAGVTTKGVENPGAAANMDDAKSWYQKPSVITVGALMVLLGGMTVVSVKRTWGAGRPEYP